MCYSDVLCPSPFAKPWYKSTTRKLALMKSICGCGSGLHSLIVLLLFIWLAFPCHMSGSRAQSAEQRPHPIPVHLPPVVSNTSALALLLLSCGLAGLEASLPLWRWISAVPCLPWNGRPTIWYLPRVLLSHDRHWSSCPQQICSADLRKHTHCIRMQSLLSSVLNGKIICIEVF